MYGGRRPCPRFRLSLPWRPSWSLPTSVFEPAPLTPSHPSHAHAVLSVLVPSPPSGREVNMRKNPNGPAARKPGDMLKDLKL